jgi:hypothetical protein
MQKRVSGWSHLGLQGSLLAVLYFMEVLNERCTVRDKSIALSIQKLDLNVLFHSIFTSP